MNGIKCIKSGTNYIIIKIPKKMFETMPNGYFFADVIIENLRGGKE